MCSHEQGATSAVLCAACLWRVTRVRADPKRAAQGTCTRSPSMPPQGPSGGTGGRARVGIVPRARAGCMPFRLGTSRGTSVETLFATVAWHFQDLPPVTRGPARAGGGGRTARTLTSDSESARHSPGRSARARGKGKLAAVAAGGPGGVVDFRLLVCALEIS